MAYWIFESCSLWHCRISHTHCSKYISDCPVATMMQSHYHLIECNAFALKQGQTWNHVSIAAPKKSLLPTMTFAFVRTRCHSHWLWQGQMSQPYFIILRRRPQGARFGQYSLLIVALRAPRLNYMQVHRASSPCLAILPLQPLSSHVIILFFYFAKSSLRACNRHDGPSVF